jgi:hypothetical protein
VGERFTTLTVPTAYVPRPPNGGTDEYRCFLVDPGLRAPAFLTGSQFRPGNVEIVHHAIVFRVAAAEVPAARQLDADDPGEGWTCFGGTGIGGDDPARALGDDWVAAWAPGGLGEERSPARTGYLLRPGAQLVLQVHYNLLNRPAGSSDRPGHPAAAGAGHRGTHPAADGVAAAHRSSCPARTGAPPACATGPCPCSTSPAGSGRRPARPSPGSRCSAGRTPARRPAPPRAATTG